MTEATENQIRAAQLIEDLWNDPELGAQIQAKAKAKFPEVKTSDVGLAPHLAPVKKQIDAQAEELKKLREELAERDKKEKERQEAADALTYTQKLAAAREAFSLTDEGYQKMLDHMKATGNYQDAMGAAAFIASQNPPPPPPGPTFGPQSLDLFGSQKERADERFRSLHTDPQNYMDEELALFVKDPAKYTAETLGH
jgi:hypothetical protein